MFEGLLEYNFKMHIFCVVYPRLYYENFTRHFTAVPLIFYLAPAKVEAFITSWDAFFYSVLTEVTVLCYQPSCHNCAHAAIIYKFVAAKILLQDCKQMIIARRRIPLL
jgi:hypothetical protein